MKSEETMTRSKLNIIRILKLFIEQGRETTPRKRLRGSLNNRTRCLAKAQEYLNTLRQSGDAKPWTGRTHLDSITAECRRTAESLRVDCTLRLRNIEYLMQAAGFLPGIAGDTTSQYIKKLVEPKQAEQSCPATQRTESVDEVLARLGGDDGTTG